MPPRRPVLLRRSEHGAKLRIDEEANAKAISCLFVLMAVWFLVRNAR